MTQNLRDFPGRAVGAWDIEVKSADAFVLDQLDFDHPAVFAAVQRIADSCRRPPGTVDDVLVALERCGLIRSVARLRDHVVR